MANSELAIRFTEDKYATKQEVCRDLRMSLIDNIWSNILSYRSNFNRYLSFKSVDKNSYSLCLCPTISSEISSLDAKLYKVMKEFSSLSDNATNLESFENNMLKKCLNALASYQEVINSEAIVEETIKGNKIFNERLGKYLDALNYVKKYYASRLDVDYLAALYGLLVDSMTLTSFYRTKNNISVDSNSLVDRVYTSAPAYLIESMMEELFNFLSNSTLSSSVKSLIAYYAIMNIKPFDDFNEEVALLFAKSVLCKGDMGESSIYLPLESILVGDQETYSKYFYESQKTTDVTYFIKFALKKVDKIAEDELNEFVKYKVKELVKDNYKLDEPIILDNKEEVQDKTIDKTLDERVEKAYSMNFSEPAPAKAEEKSSVINEAAFTIPEALDEREAKELENFLLETDPFIRKHEARFYSKHCTVGKYYTIAQYKKTIRCVYETARTSMDHLAELGYYNKQQIKNKFIYIAVKKN